MATAMSGLAGGAAGVAALILDHACAFLEALACPRPSFSFDESGHQRNQAAAMPAGGAAGGQALFETVEPAVQFHVSR
jgi:hypothetical protein